MEKSLLLYAIAWSLGPWTMSLPVAAEGGTQTKEILSAPVTIDRPYDFDSREWPGEMRYVVLSESERLAFLV